MSTGWDLDSKTGSSKAEFTKFPQGITVIRVVENAPFARWTHWQPKHNRSINCPGRGCPICEIRNQQKANKEPLTQGVGRRFAIQIINRETGKLEICEQGKTWFEDLRDIMDTLSKKGKNLSDVDITVKRRGQSKDDTSYRLDIADDGDYPLSDEDKKLMEGMVNLEEFFKPHTNEQIMGILNGGEWAEVMKGSAQEQTESHDEEVEVR